MAKKSPNQLFKKLFYKYTIIIICIVAGLAGYFISESRARVLNTNIKYRNMMQEKAADYLEECAKTSGYLQSGLYQSQAVMQDLLMYLQTEGEAYQKYRLDTYMASQSLGYEGFDDYVEKSIQGYPEIISIELISYDKSEVTVCYPEGKTYIHQNGEARIAEAETGQLASKGVFSFMKEIRNPDTLAGVGCMIVNFKAQEFESIQKYYEVAQLKVYNQSGTVVYQSGNEPKDRELLQLKTEVKDYTIYSYMDKQKAAQIPASLTFTIVGIGVLVIGAGVLLVRSHLSKLTGRLNRILDGMQRVTTGDLEVRLEADEKGDELDMISTRFNEMCQELDRYIQKSYLAEIEQKNAEMEALQSQINPHFLYNTLEAIRMKAICNGDKEVGKMLYSMAVIFRSQLKEDDMITVIQEIHYCKKYLELFEYRYQGKFTSEVTCPEELMNYKVMKFILQPIIENYFIHGIRAEQDGNKIRIFVERDGEALLIHVEDNGNGMDEAKMAQKNEELKKDIADSKKSVGITNVNRRIRAVYGEGYGVWLAQVPSGGLHVIVKAGIFEGEDDEKSNVN